MTVYDPNDVAEWFLIQESMTIMKVLKLVYLAHGFKMALADDVKQVMFNDDVEAWKFGPVVRTIYDEYKESGGCKIEQPAENKASSLISSEDVTILEAVYRSYGTLDAWELSALTHQKDTPWYKVWNSDENIQDQIVFDVVIPNQLIKDHFFSILEDSRQFLAQKKSP